MQDRSFRLKPENVLDSYLLADYGAAYKKREKKSMRKQKRVLEKRHVSNLKRQYINGFAR
ncbi:hypothetical protein D8M03_16065 [Lysinibacillus endophyticus]|uniref:Uncharacterized protein n=1 Tax=Ureibacillus endophyticus TaxID=1978490 RepID=A0A494YTL8_9BACL|nr:hypothetical protein D8M03_16065 [Lysinibacillus endophyticus]